VKALNSSPSTAKNKQQTNKNNKMIREGGRTSIVYNTNWRQRS
jgi:hypothetical protein